VQITLYAVGKIRDPGWNVLVEDYLGRIRHYSRCEIVELKDDAELIRRWPNDDVNVALEVDGDCYSSQQFAGVLTRWASQGKGRIAIIIGGAEGIPKQFSRQANCRLSLSSMTLPHRLARVLILEQLYRALTILKGEPYARES
jgi:23S rRNA (pseudouridine1915-N3)-methyltransferase